MRALERLQATMRFWCFACRVERDVELPEHPAGLGTCTHCGARLDLADAPRADVRRYLACYREIGT